MTQQQIEQAAEEMMPYSKDGSSAGRSVFGKHYRRGFRAGAQWRINSVWHDEKVIPNRNLDKKIFGCGEDVILKPKYRQVFEICEVLWDEDEQKIYLSGERETFFMDDVEIWAYILDLLPERKEETK